MSKKPSPAQTESQEAVRARHQRADARPDEPVPLRGARRLPADRRRSRSSTTTRKACPRSRATRARRAASSTRSSRQRRRRHRRRACRSRRKTARRRQRPPVPPDRGDQRRAAAALAAGQGRQPDPRRRACTCKQRSRSATSCWCRRTSTCASRRARSACRRGLLQRQGARGHRPPLHRRARSCRRISGTRTARTWSRGSRAATPTTACSGPLVPTLHVNEFVYDETRRAAALRAGEGDRRAAPRCSRRCATTRTPKNNVWGITARNREQNFALNLLMNPEVDFVTLLGQAGTGKTLLDARRRA